MLKSVMNVLMVPVLGFALLIAMARADVIIVAPEEPVPSCLELCNKCGSPVWGSINGELEKYHCRKSDGSPGKCNVSTGGGSGSSKCSNCVGTCHDLQTNEWHKCFCDEN